MSGLNKILLPVLRFTGRVHCRSAIREESRRKVLDLKTLFPRYVNTIQICKQYSTNHVSRGSDGATEASNTIYPHCKFKFERMHRIQDLKTQSMNINHICQNYYTVTNF